MTATDRIRSLMSDGRARAPAEILSETGMPQHQVRNALKKLANGRANPMLIRLASPPLGRRAFPTWTIQHDHGRGFLYRINPNCPAVIAAGQ